MNGADRKLGELVLYVAAKSEDDPRFGAIKLNKILFYADFVMFGKTGRSITDQPYQRLEWGPAPRRLVPVRKGLVDGGDLAIQKRDYIGRIQQRAVALRPANLELFTAAEIAEVDEIIDTLWDANATEVSELSHRTMAWELAGDQEEIPFESVFLSDRKLSDAEQAHALTL